MFVVILILNFTILLQSNELFKFYNLKLNKLATHNVSTNK